MRWEASNNGNDLGVRIGKENLPFAHLDLSCAVARAVNQVVHVQAPEVRDANTKADIGKDECRCRKYSNIIHCLD